MIYIFLHFWWNTLIWKFATSKAWDSWMKFQQNCHHEVKTVTPAFIHREALFCATKPLFIARVIHQVYTFHMKYESIIGRQSIYIQNRTYVFPIVSRTPRINYPAHQRRQKTVNVQKEVALNAHKKRPVIVTHGCVFLRRCSRRHSLIVYLRLFISPIRVFLHAPTLASFMHVNTPELFGSSLLLLIYRTFSSTNRETGAFRNCG